MREGLAGADIIIEADRIAAVLPAASAPDSLPGTDLRAGMVFPAFADMHTHIDKAHIWERSRNPDGSFIGALSTVQEDREAFWSVDDLRLRMDFSLRAAYAHGTALLRTHLDCMKPQYQTAFEVFREMRAAWAGRVELQAARALRYA